MQRYAINCILQERAIDDERMCAGNDVTKVS